MADATVTMAPHSEPLSFLDVLQATPQLLKALEATLDSRGQCRSSLKTLRLVCRHTRIAGLHAVTECRVALLPESLSQQKLPPLHQLEMAKLVANSPLRRLCVEFFVTPGR